MARKICPTCKWLNGGSAAECSQCGQLFDSESIVPAGRPKTRRCSKCDVEVSRLAETCICGHTFDDVRELREQAEDRVRVGWSFIALGLLGLIACTFLMIWTSGVFLILWGGGAALIARGIVTRNHAKADLVEIRNARAKLPAAKVVS
jgi:hypothetical protein